VILPIIGFWRRISRQAAPSQANFQLSIVTAGHIKGLPPPPTAFPHQDSLTQESRKANDHSALLPLQAPPSKPTWPAGQLQCGQQPSPHYDQLTLKPDAGHWCRVVWMAALGVKVGMDGCGHRPDDSILRNLVPKCDVVRSRYLTLPLAILQIRR
jgi:hypothetical protein